MTLVASQPAAFIAMLAGDPASAETHLRFAYESLGLMGEKGNLGTAAALLARAIAAQGEKRYDEADQLIAISQEAAAGEDLVTQIIGQGLSARLLADRGRHAEAVGLACSAVTLAAQTDLLSQHADALLDLAHVLDAAGRFPDAQAAAAQARDLYQRKSNLPGIRESLAYLSPSTHPPERTHRCRTAQSQESSLIRTAPSSNLVVAVFGFDPGAPVEISGQATQTNGAVASVDSVQPMPAANGPVYLQRIAAVPGRSAFTPGFPVTIVARAAQVWITTLEEEGGGGPAQSRVDGTLLESAWAEEKAHWAVSWQGSKSGPPGRPSLRSRRRG